MIDSPYALVDALAVSGDAVLVRIQTGVERGPCGRTDSSRCERTVETDASLGDTVDVRRFYDRIHAIG